MPHCPISRGESTAIAGYVSEETCRRWREAMFERRDRWVRRFDFYTFGRAWYAEVESGCLPVYHAAAMEANALVAELEGFRDTMLSAADLLASPSGESLPTRARRENLGPYWCDTGLHMLGTDCPQGGSQHLDLEGMAPYPEAMLDPETRAFSAVLVAAAPAYGGDLLVWTKRRYLAQDTVEQDPDPEEAPTALKCEVGSLFLFDSFLLHQVGPFKVDPSAPWRISGVIHFLYRDTPCPHWEYWF